jgi:predicted NAD/FAD-binding protein
VLKVAAALGDRVQLSKTIASIARTTATNAQGEAVDVVTVVDEKGAAHAFDKLVFACHPDQVRGLFLVLCFLV